MAEVAVHPLAPQPLPARPPRAVLPTALVSEQRKGCKRAVEPREKAAKELWRKGCERAAEPQAKAAKEQRNHERLCTCRSHGSAFVSEQTTEQHRQPAPQSSPWTRSERLRNGNFMQGGATRLPRPAFAFPPPRRPGDPATDPAAPTPSAAGSIVQPGGWAYRQPARLHPALPFPPPRRPCRHNSSRTQQQSENEQASPAQERPSNANQRQPTPLYLWAIGAADESCTIHIMQNEIIPNEMQNKP